MIERETPTNGGERDSDEDLCSWVTGWNEGLTDKDLCGTEVIESDRYDFSVYF